VHVDLDEDLRTVILSGRRHRETKAVTIRMDPYQVQALRRIATVKSIPYQTLIRHWVAMHIKEELGDAAA
jgi:predicted DNA binding CopG/RHH family protein